MTIQQKKISFEIPEENDNELRKYMSKEKWDENEEIKVDEEEEETICPASDIITAQLSE